MQSPDDRRQEQYIIERELGRGSFSVVYKARHRVTGEEFAIKQVQLDESDSKAIQNTLNEVRILCSVSHPNVVGYKEAFMRSPKEIWIVMEFARGGDLSSRIEQAKMTSTAIAEGQIWSWLIQILLGLRALHDLKIMHRDIKPANIFLSERGKEAKIGDLNVAKVGGQDLASTQVGTPLYLAPEIWTYEPYSSKCDIFSLGCLIHELAALKVPFEAESIPQLYSKVSATRAPRIPPQYTEQLQSFISLCLEKNPAKRPSADQLLALPSVRSRLLASQFEPQVQRCSLLINTIPIPENIEDLNGLLPSKDAKTRNKSFLTLSVQHLAPPLPIERKSSKDFFPVLVPVKIRPNVSAVSKKLPPVKSAKPIPKSPLPPPKAL